MMLVDADSIEAKFIGICESVDIVAIEAASKGRIEEFVGTPDPCRVIVIFEVGRQVGPGHEMKKKNFTCSPQSIRTCRLA
jgi:hypothetical protein